MTEISIVVPVRNEEENIKPFLQKAENVMDKIGKAYEIIFALDPSSDNTEKIILGEIVNVFTDSSSIKSSKIFALPGLIVLYI